MERERRHVVTPLVGVRGAVLALKTLRDECGSSAVTPLVGVRGAVLGPSLVARSKIKGGKGFSYDTRGENWWWCWHRHGKHSR